MFHIFFWTSRVESSLYAKKWRAPLGTGVKKKWNVNKESESERAGPKAALLGRKHKKFNNPSIIYFARWKLQNPASLASNVHVQQPP